MRTVRIGGVTLGEGMPRICIPVTGTTAQQIVQGARAAQEAQADICEWRADFFEALEDETAVSRMIARMRETLGGIPLLFTIRTRAEGGQAALAPEAYARLNACAAKSGADCVDVEMLQPGAREALEGVHAQGVPVIASSHDFEKTPPSQELLARIEHMWASGADIAKIAVMPRSAQDVLRLLEVTQEAVRAQRGPVVTMSMGRLGGVSRLAGETFGSAMTFGSAGSASAPGQIDARTLRAVLSALHGQA